MTYYIVSLMRLGTILARKRSCWLIIPAFPQHGVGYIWILSDPSSIKTHETHVNFAIFNKKYIIFDIDSRTPVLKLHDSMIFLGFPEISMVVSLNHHEILGLFH